MQITRQHYRGRRWHVVHDPASHRFYRLNPIAYEFVGLLDGRRRVEQAWTIILERHGDAAPTQGEVVELISQLYNANLLAGDISPDVEQLLSRGRERLKRKAASQAIGIMYFRVRLFNPDRMLTWLEPLFRPLINPVGLLLWAIWVGAALVMLAPRWDELVGGFESAIAPRNWPWLAVVFIVTKAIHETGHGVICKRFGGQVPELGVMLLVLFPAPYVDASACWSFPSKWRRLAVGAAGMIFELAVAAAAVFVWLNTLATPDALLHQLSYNAMFTASISTILFNANPLMRFDGYYMLSDFLEVPNLMQRSMNMLKYCCQRYLYRLDQARPVTTIPAERRILLVYGVAALAYRIFLFFSITLFVMGKLFAVGLVLAVWTASVWFVLPVAKLVHWHASAPMLADCRLRAVATTVGLVAVALVSLGAVPVPDRRRADGVMEAVDRSGVFIQVDAFVRDAHARPGQCVRQGEPILTCDSPELRARLRLLRARLAEAVSRERDLTERMPFAAGVARRHVETIREQIAFIEDQMARLVVRAPHDGVVVGDDPARLIGAYVRRGDPVCEVIDPRRTRVVATLSTAQAAPLLDVGPDRFAVQFRRLSAPATTLVGGSVRLLEAGQRALPHPALGYPGGGSVPTEADDPTGRVAASPRFTLYVEPPQAGPWAGVPGERVVLRLHLPHRPLLSQWIDRLHRLVQGRVRL